MTRRFCHAGCHVMNEIAECCKVLKLSRNIVENSKTLSAETHPEFLLKLLKLELEHRVDVRYNRLIKKAGFQNLKSFNQLDFKEIKLPQSITSEELKKCDFIVQKQNIIMYGNVGTGKTHLATAIGIEACKAGKKVGFYRTAALVNQLIEVKKEGRLSLFMKKISGLDLLICDEWGYVPMDREGCQLLFQIISDCYERRSLIITTNLEFSKWINVFYDEQMTAAMIDRMIHHSHLLIFDGQSYRMKHSNIRS